MKKKLFSVILVISLMFSIILGFSVQAFAQEQEQKTNAEKINDAIISLRSYYLKSDTFSFRVAMGYNFTSDDSENDLNIIGQRYKINENPDSASAYAGNIMGLIAAGKNPRDYNGNNYVKALADFQNEAGKFLIGEWDDYSTTMAFSILALDMAKAEYNVDKAVEALLSYQGEDGGFGGADETAMCIMALGNHRGINGVNTAIANGIAYLKANQKDSGGFESWGAENPYSVSAVIQGLIAVGEDPLSKEWTKNGNTMLDALLSYKVDDHFEHQSEWGTEVDMTTEQAFCALADLYRGKSMYQELSLNINDPAQVKIKKPSSTKLIKNGKLKLFADVCDDSGQLLTGHNLMWSSTDTNIAEVNDEGLVIAKKEGTVTIMVKVKGYEDIQDTIELTIEPEEFTIERIGNDVIRNGSEAKIEIMILNCSNETKAATLIVVLYEKDSNKMINYSFVKEIFEPEKSRNMGAGFLVPATGEYIIKGFVWDNMEGQNIILANPITIQVEK